MASQNMVPRLRFPKGADAIYIVDEYGRALPMKKSSKNPCIYYFHEKYFEPGYVSRRTAKEYSGKLILRTGEVLEAYPVKIVDTAPWNPWQPIVYIVKIKNCK